MTINGKVCGEVIKLDDDVINAIPLIKSLVESLDDPSGELDFDRLGMQGITPYFFECIKEWVNYERDRFDVTAQVKDGTKWVLHEKYIVTFESKVLTETEDPLSNREKYPQRLLPHRKTPWFMCTEAGKAMLEKWLLKDRLTEIEPLLLPLKFLGCPPFDCPRSHLSFDNVGIIGFEEFLYDVMLFHAQYDSVDEKIKYFNKTKMSRAAVDERKKLIPFGADLYEALCED